MPATSKSQPRTRLRLLACAAFLGGGAVLAAGHWRTAESPLVAVSVTVLFLALLTCVAAARWLTGTPLTSTARRREGMATRGLHVRLPGRPATATILRAAPAGARQFREKKL